MASATGSTVEVHTSPLAQRSQAAVIHGCGNLVRDAAQHCEPPLVEGRGQLRLKLAPMTPNTCPLFSMGSSAAVSPGHTRGRPR